MQTLKEHKPTCFDSSEAGFIPDRSDWLLVPVMQTRDSGPFALSNFATALERLGGESDNVEVHRFGHWGPGWYEIIIVRPDSPAESIAEDIEADLESYPLLDETDFSRREWEEYEEGWESYGARDFRRELVSAFDLSGTASESALGDADRDTLRTFYEALTPSGEYYIGESDGIAIPTDHAVERCTREQLAAFLRSLRSIPV